MQKIVLLLLPLILFGCEQTFDNVIDIAQNNYQVEFVSPVDSIAYRPDDSLATIRINFTSASVVNEVFCNVIASDQTVLEPSPLKLFDNGDPANGDNTAGDNRFANKIPLSESYPNGTYDIKYFVKNPDGSTRQVAWGSFKYNNGQNNLPPFIQNDVIEPDTAVVNDTTVIFTSVEASDPNGQNDIEIVFFIVYKPDGTTNNARIEMFDDGDTIEHGDLVAGDGIYSRLIQINQTNDKGTYRFQFQAKDRGGKFSNTIDHFVLIQ